MHQLYIRPVYGPDEFCQDFDIGRSTFYDEIRAGRLKAFKIGRFTKVAGEDAIAWRDQHRAQGYRRTVYPVRTRAAA
jgi:hypothetical protein